MTTSSRHLQFLPIADECICYPDDGVPSVLYKFDNTKGILPKKAMLIHAKEENKNACLRFNCFSLVKLVKTIRIPIIIVMIEDEKKLLLFSSYIS